MDILFKELVVGLVPVPVQQPPAQMQLEPYSAEALQRAYMDVSKEHTYQQFQLLPGGAGAQFINSPDDGVLIQPGLIQVRHAVTSTTEVARQRCTTILKTLVDRLGVRNAAGVGIKVWAHVPITGSARAFVGDRLMQGSEHVDELGGDFFPGGVKYMAIGPAGGVGSPLNGQIGQTLLIEPWVQDDSFVYVEYDMQRQQLLSGVDSVSEWIDEAFHFVSVRAIALLERGA